jgi:LysR family transcriptional regulator for metE and metH
MLLDVRHLELVQAIASAGGLSRATAQLHLTESALSRQLGALEEALATKLFLRTGRRMLLTPAGERLLSSSAGVLETLRHTEDDIRRLSADGAGLVRLATECYTCYHWLPALMREFRTRHPRVEVRILAEATRRPLEALLDGRIDLAIMSTPAKERPVREVPLFDDELVAVLPPGHRLERRAFLEAHHLAEESLILYVAPEESTLVQEVMRPAGVVPARVTQIQLTEAILEMVKAGLGISVMARWAVAPHLEAGTLRALRLTRRGLHRTWRAATLRTKEPALYLEDFIRLLSSRSRRTAEAIAGPAVSR